MCSRAKNGDFQCSVTKVCPVVSELKKAMSQRLCYRSLGSSAADGSLCIISRADGTVGVRGAPNFWTEIEAKLVPPK